ncbi:MULTISPECIES: phytanoyl-CoA dioxygenase family protein [unclassified Plantactinospora]|uniref:phytanoyl-CoA dioxygenase family protein n=1 Tax=unclassified Plantactinospora TaxID=2631981 RepID=UPI00131ED642|nr:MULTISPECIES: phytanoyl-CoA dioxygenase family protein [unclassified Plantactinospora]
MESAFASEVPLTDEERSRLADDGYLVLRGVLPDDALQPVRDALAAVVDRMARQWRDEGLIEQLHEDAPFTTRWWLIRQQLPALRPVTWRRVLVSEAMYRLWRRPELTGRMRSWLGDELWAHDTWNGRPREPWAPVQKIGWHQDAYYLRGWEPADGNILTCWIPLVPVDARAGCLQILPGSHRHGVIPPEFDEFRNKNVSVERLGHIEPVTLPTVPGDVVIFTESTVHQALPNESEGVRWTVDVRFGAESPAMRRKARGGYLCRTAGDPGRIESYDEWAAKYDPRTGAMAAQLRAIDAAAMRSGSMARDISTY